MTGETVARPPNVRRPRCGEYTRKTTEAEALADCPVRDYSAEETAEHG